MRVWKTMHRIIFIARIVLLLLLIVIFIPEAMSRPVAGLVNAELQQARCERIAKDALILQYRPAIEQPQAISELQVLLPVFQQEQVALTSYPDSQVQLLVLQSNSDYLPMVDAVKSIIANQGKPIRANQVDIILLHEHSYEVAANQIVMLMQQDLTAQSTQIFGIAFGIILLSIVLVVISRRKEEKP